MHTILVPIIANSIKMVTFCHVVRLMVIIQGLIHLMVVTLLVN